MLDPCDVLVIGAGAAGLRTAIEARLAGATVHLVCKGEAGGSGSTPMSGCSMIAALPDDPPQARDVHFRDTLAVGQGLHDPALVRYLVDHAGAEVLRLEEFGVKVHRKPARFQLGRAAGEPSPSAVEPDYAGWPFARRGLGLTHPLAETARRLGVRIFEHGSVIRLHKADGRVCGAWAVLARRVEGGGWGAEAEERSVEGHDPRRERQEPEREGGQPNGHDAATSRRSRLSTLHSQLFRAGAVVLAAGGAGSLYSLTSNSPDVVGDSYALALEAGAALRDMEFVEFNPCRCLVPDIPTNLPPLFEDGAVLRDRSGERFIFHWEPAGETAAFRESMPRAIAEVVRQGRGVEGGVYLDATGLDAALWQTRYRALFEALKQAGADPRKDWLVVGVRANLFAGGVVCRPDGSTEVPGLFVAGEAAGGVHGAKRFGGNAIAHALVSGAAAGRSAAAWAQARQGESASQRVGESVGRQVGESAARQGGTPDPPLVPASDSDLQNARQELRETMWNEVGLVRSEDSLQQAAETLSRLRRQLTSESPARFGAPSPGLDSDSPTRRLTDSPTGPPAELPTSPHELAHMLLVAEAVVKSALLRRESRGPHFRADYPQAAPSWLGSIYVRLTPEGLLEDFVPLAGPQR